MSAPGVRAEVASRGESAFPVLPTGLVSVRKNL